MPSHDLSDGEMNIAVEYLLDEQRERLIGTPYLNHMVVPLEDLLQTFVDEQVDPQVAVREIAGILKHLTARFDDKARALDHFLNGFALDAEDEDDRAAIRHAQSEVLPAGLQLVNHSTGDKAAEAQLMPGRTRGAVGDTLERLRIRDGSLLDFLYAEIVPLAEAIGDAHRRRLAIEQAAGRRTRGFNLATRRRFIQLDRALRDLIDINEADAETREALLGFTDRLVLQAERRAAQRRSQQVRAEGDGAGPGDPSADAAPVEGDEPDPPAAPDLAEGDRPGASAAPDPVEGDQPGASAAPGEPPVDSEPGGGGPGDPAEEGESSASPPLSRPPLAPLPGRE